MKPVDLSLSQARRISLAAQGFNNHRQQARPGLASLRRLASRLLAIQIDSVNVLVRSHYMPAFSRLGPYPASSLNELAYKKRELFEYWGHMASLIPVSMHPLFRWRMKRHEAMAWGAGKGRDHKYVEAVLAEVAEHGPLTAAELSDPGKKQGPWWGWAEGKQALEWLLASGVVAVSGRRGFEREYDLTERVIPASILGKPAVPADEAMSELLVLSTKALGVGTAKDIRTYFNIDAWWDRAVKDGKRRPSKANHLLTELAEDGRLRAARVEGWRHPAFMHPAAKVPASIDAKALLTPFDSLIWERDRTARLFGFQYTIEIYVPAPKRRYGYYVLPFLLGDSLVARADLKADRKQSALLVQSAFREKTADEEHVAGELWDELKRMATWLGLERIELKKRGNLASALGRAKRR